MLVSVLIPTLRRPESLSRAVRSVLAQSGVDALELVVVDNSPEASARDTVAALASGAPWPIVFVHEPTPGVSTARNSGLAVAKGELIAFLDDDEEAPPTWLAEMLRVHREFAADVTFGAIRGCAPESAGWAKPYLDRLFSRTGPATAGLSVDHWGCGNSLLSRGVALPGPRPFDTDCDQMGGEDDVLFSRLQASGARFAWAPEAWVWEHPVPHRATLSHALRRAFAYGQGPSQICVRNRDWLGVARWTLIGAAQVAVFGAAAALLWLLRHPRRADMLDRTARGLGKMLWWDVLAPRFYGSAEILRSDAVSA